MSNQQVTYTINLNNNVRASLRETEEQALKLDSVMSSLNDTFRMLGFGFAAHTILNEAKEWVQATADYENAVNRIRFASDNLVEGADNVKFITNEVEKFRIPLQSATDDYGKFLAMVQGSGMAISTVQELHDNILMISKIKHLDAGQLSAGVMNLGKMLEAGAMDARHLRPLEMQLSGIGKFIADELGVSIHELAVLRNKGKLTEIDPQVLLEAIKKQAKSLDQYLPEALNSLQSEINELDNTWLIFKQNIVEDIRPELIEFFHDIQDGIGWMKEHRDIIISSGKTILAITELYVGYKIAMFAVNTGLSAYKSLSIWWTGETVAQTTALGRETIAVNALAASIERLNFVQNASNASFITNAAGISMANTVGNRYQMTAGQNLASGAAGAEGAALGASLASQISGLVLRVGIVWLAAEVAEAFGGFGKDTKGNNISKWDALGIGDWNSSPEAVYLNKIGLIKRFDIEVGGLQDETLKRSRELIQQWQAVYQGLPLQFDDKGNIKSLEEAYGTNSPVLNKFKQTSDFQYALLHGVIESPTEYAQKLDTKPTKPIKDFKLDTSSKIRGNSVTNITIDIKELIGMNNPQFSVKNMDDMDKIKDVVGEEVVKILGSAVNDSQLVKDRH